MTNWASTSKNCKSNVPFMALCTTRIGTPAGSFPLLSIIGVSSRTDCFHTSVVASLATWELCFVRCMRALLFDTQDLTWWSPPCLNRKLLLKVIALFAHSRNCQEQKAAQKFRSSQSPNFLGNTKTYVTIVSGLPYEVLGSAFLSAFPMTCPRSQ